MVRAATVDDADTVAKIHVKTWQVTYRGQVPDSYLDELSSRDRVAVWSQRIASPQAETYRLWVAEIDGHIVGFADSGPTRDEDGDAATAEVNAIYVTPANWGAGMGRALLSRAVTETRRLGFRAVTLWVLATNERTRRFYEAAGWRFDGAKKTEARGGCDLNEVRYRIDSADAV